MVRVCREFSQDWVFLYAPLVAPGLGLVAAFFATRRFSAARLALLIVTVGRAALFAGLMLFWLGGLV